MQRPFFSIVVPLYKTEAFLEECLLSVKNQTFIDLECIVVNDGSPGSELVDFSKNQNSLFNHSIDLTGVISSGQAKKIFDRVVGHDSRFKYFEKQNEGLGPTKNFALDKATGLRLVILDSDDYLDINYLQNAFYVISKHKPETIVYGNVKIVENSHVSTFISSQKFVPKTNSLKSMLVFPTWTVTPVSYFWDIDILKKYDVKNVYKSKGEDTCFAIDMIIAYGREYGKKVVKEDFKQIIDSLYVYRQFTNQMTKSEGFEIELFDHTTSGLKQRIASFKQIGLIYHVLVILFVWRFQLYRRRLMTTSKIHRQVYGSIAKLLTAISLVTSSTKKA